MAGVGIIISGNVLGYSDDNPLPTTFDMVDLYNKRAINTDMYGHNDVLATLDRFRSLHTNQYSPLEDDELDSLSPLAMAYEEMDKSSSSYNRSIAHPVPTTKAQEPTQQISRDVADVMNMLNDCILNP